jgi:hypothetical protein
LDRSHFEGFFTPLRSIQNDMALKKWTFKRFRSENRTYAKSKIRDDSCLFF